jgi:hypothetical protein
VWKSTKRIPSLAVHCVLLLDETFEAPPTYQFLLFFFFKIIVPFSSGEGFILKDISTVKAIHTVSRDERLGETD